MTKGRTQNNIPKLGKHVDVEGECKTSRQDDSTSYVGDDLRSWLAFIPDKLNLLEQSLSGTRLRSQLNDACEYQTPAIVLGEFDSRKRRLLQQKTCLTVEVPCLMSDVSGDHPSYTITKRRFLRLVKQRDQASGWWPTKVRHTFREPRGTAARRATSHGK